MPKKSRARSGEFGPLGGDQMLMRQAVRFHIGSNHFLCKNKTSMLENIWVLGYDVEMENKKNQALQEKRNNELIDAAICGDESAIAKALSVGASPLAIDAGGFTALMWAARYDLGGCAQMLLPVSDLKQADPSGRAALEIAKDGAGPDSVCAKLIEAYELAMDELAAIGANAAIAAKSQPKKFRL